MIHRDVLVSSVDTIRIAVAKPFVRYALCSAPYFICRACKFGVFVALTIIALMTFVLVGIIKTVIVTVAYINSWYTIAIVTGEQITEASTSLGLTVAGWFVATVETIVVTVAVPRCRYASVIGASEAILRARTLSAVYRILVAVVAAIIVTIA